MEPRITKRERKLHLSYELSHRIHSAQIYPIQAPNGSTIIVYGHDKGLRILWRGGRRRRGSPAPAAQPNGHPQAQEVITIDDSDDEPAPQVADSQVGDEEDELDPDCPYQGIVQDVNLDMGVHVLHLALLSTHSPLPQNSILRKSGIIAAACSDGSIQTICFELQPPLDAEKQQYIETTSYSQEGVKVMSTPCTSLALKTVAIEPPAVFRGEEIGFMLVAAVRNQLLVSHTAPLYAGFATSNGTAAMPLTLPHAAKHVALHPSPRSRQILVTDVSGAVRIFDPVVSGLTGEELSHYDLTGEYDEDHNVIERAPGSWLYTFTTPYIRTGASLARRKQILDAAWVLSGKAILALLEDGEWGIWSLTGDSQAGGNMDDFVLRGLLGAPTTGDSSQSARQPKSKLAPMTPNTRKVKSETFFAGPPKAAGAAARGGISVVTSSVRAGQTDESVVIWYGADVYNIPSLQTFWQRNTNRNNGGGGLGSLYAPGLNHITDINLMNEAITSISQFAPSSASSGVGQMNTQRDLLVSAEHRLIILQALRPPGPARTLFSQAAPVSERPIGQDQVMLDAGHLDIGGMDRMLDGMANGDARPRRVGFAR